MTASSVEVIKMSDAGKLAKIMSSKKAQNIVNYIAKHKDCTATQISKALKLPASTVHYNLKALLKAKIITDDSFHYSSKGKEVSHYEISNKAIVIVPEEKSPSALLRLQTLLPGLLGSVVLAGGVLIYKFFNASSGSLLKGNIDASLSDVAFEEGAQAMMYDSSNELVAGATSPQAESLAREIVTTQTHTSFWQTLVSSDFFWGVLITIGIFVLGGFLYWLLKRKSRK